MSDHIITCDIDGVIADGAYVPAERQNVAGTANLGLADPDVLQYLGILCSYNNVYLLSHRPWLGALRGVKQWLHEILYAGGFSESDLAGVICGIPPERKLALATQLGATYHIDDAPEVILCYNGVGTVPLLLHNPHRPLPLLKYNLFFPTWKHLADWLHRKGLMGPPVAAVRRY